MCQNNILSQIEKYSDWYLSRYSASRHSFRKALEKWLIKKRYQINDSISSFIDNLINSKINDGSINDTEYIGFKIRKWRERGWSDNVISLKLNEMGFCREIVKKALINDNEINSSSVAEQKVTEILIRRNLSCHNSLSSEEVNKRQIKALRFISRRGFSRDTAEKILSKIGYQ